MFDYIFALALAVSAPAPQYTLYTQPRTNELSPRTLVQRFTSVAAAQAEFTRDGTRLVYSPDYAYVLVGPDGDHFYSYFLGSF